MKGLLQNGLFTEKFLGQKNEKNFLCEQPAEG
jgi:hypothetical protein